MEFTPTCFCQHLGSECIQYYPKVSTKANTILSQGVEKVVLGYIKNSLSIWRNSHWWTRSCILLNIVKHAHDPSLSSFDRSLYYDCVILCYLLQVFLCCCSTFSELWRHILCEHMLVKTTQFPYLSQISRCHFTTFSAHYIWILATNIINVDICQTKHNNLSYNIIEDWKCHLTRFSIIS